ncbi:DUF397 domain-containing protein [Streptomyces sp. NPDC088725]|uniref:DUF397 domain-containing protein n=1 Tax=Streptomyces sp. NPDC088725 TaxID=3365873 RepID=UPI003820C404
MPSHNWQKSSYSGTGGNCINVASDGDGLIKLRESDQPDTIVTTTPEKLRAFILGVKAGEFDHFVAGADAGGASLTPSRLQG